MSWAQALEESVLLLQNCATMNINLKLRFSRVFHVAGHLQLLS